MHANTHKRKTQWSVFPFHYTKHLDTLLFKTADLKPKRGVPYKRLDVHSRHQTPGAPFY